MRPAIALCVAPVLSVLRPALGVSLLQASLADQPVDARVHYLNLDYANEIGLDLNEWLAEDVPTHLLVGDWLFAPLVASPDELAARWHDAELRRVAGETRYRELGRLRQRSAAFVEHAAERVLIDSPRIVGFSTVFQQTGASLAIARAIKRRAPTTQICFGGANCHGPMGKTLLECFPQIDTVFTGYADTTFAHYVADTIALRDAPLAEVIHRHDLERDAPMPPARPVLMDALTIPRYDDYFAQLKTTHFARQIAPALPFESTRGCWWGQKHHCTFCGLNADSMTFNAKSGPRVLDELRVLAERHGITRFCAADNIMALDHIDSVFSPLARAAGDWRFFYEIKANLSEARLRALALGGVTWVQPGIESLDDAVLKIMRKGVTALANIRLLRNLVEFGVGTVWNILYGFPGEPAEAYARMAEIAPWLEHLWPPTSCSRIRIDRFSPNFEQAEAMGFAHVRPARSYAALYGQNAARTRDLAYFFEGRPTQGDDFSYAQALRDAVSAWRAAWYETDRPPQLQLERLGTIGLVTDTRRCATQSVLLLDEPSLALLDAFREPSPVASTLRAIEERFPGHDAAGALILLSSARLVLVQGHSALALTVEARGQLVDDAARADFPWGHRVSRDADHDRAGTDGGGA